MSWCESYAFQITPWRNWNEQARPFPPNGSIVTHYERGKYDLAIVHFMCETAQPNTLKFRVADDIRKTIGTYGLPIVGIMHESPYLLGTDNTIDKNLATVVKDIIGDIPIVTNSKEAAEHWGFGHPIIHGCPEDLFTPADHKLPRIIMCMSRPNSYAHNVASILTKRKVKVYRVKEDLRPKSFNEYQAVLGQSLVFFHPWKESAMPRARTEAAFAGCAIAQIEGAQGSEYFRSAMELPADDPSHAADILIEMLGDVGKTKARGLRCREEVKQKLSWKRYEQDWINFLTNEVL